MTAMQLTTAGPSGAPTPLLMGGAGVGPGPAPPSSCLLFFEGDQILDEDTREELGDALLSPQAHLDAMVAKAGPGAWVGVVGPSRVTPEGFSAYENLLPRLTATGEPIGYDARGYKAGTHLASLLSTASSACSSSGSSITAPGHPPPQLLLLGLPLTLVGFSKAGTVLNQVLIEMAAHEAHAAGGGAAGGAPPAAQPRPSPTASSAPERAPSDAARVLDSVTQVHYLDAGLNGAGVHMTDARHAESLGARSIRIPLTVAFHGTPRQWNDRRRPWIAAEKDRSVAVLRAAAAAAAGIEEGGGSGSRLTVTERVYFEGPGQRPSLRQHFEVIGAAELQLGVRAQL
ncbi:hypothetical protein FOA52_010853 [Chlamydomonas sp. UWO 241]|nr:hypothetical protein FOA52_010853 [Chlamydomonas sp. UWO 241]